MADPLAWQDLAACLGDPDGMDGVFFPVSALPEYSDDAKAVCATCPVIAECLDRALATRSNHGVWGGLTPEERAALVRRPRRTA